MPGTVCENSARLLYFIIDDIADVNKSNFVQLTYENAFLASLSAFYAKCD